jgi:hypothetical protein
VEIEGLQTLLVEGHKCRITLSLSLVEIQASNLGVAFDDDSGFVLFEIAFGVVFNFEHPL